MKKLLLLPLVAILLAMFALLSPVATGTASAQVKRVQMQSSMALTNSQVRPFDTSVYIWGTNVNARYSSPLGIAQPSCHYYPSTNCSIEGHFTRQWVTAICQQQGASVTAEGITNNWWSLIYGFGTQVWVSNIYIQGGQKIAGVPDCNFTP